MVKYNPEAIEYNKEKLSDLYRNIIANCKNIVIKVGTEVLTDPKRRLRKDKIRDIAEQAVALHDPENGNLVTIVTSGAIAAGMGKLGITEYDKDDIPTKQALASTGQIDLMKEYDTVLMRHGLYAGQFQPTYHDLKDPLHVNNFRNSSRRSRELAIIPVLNENDAFSVEELLLKKNGNDNGQYGSVSFGDNDRLSLMVAEVINAQVLFMLMGEKGLMNYEENRKIDIVYSLEGIDRHFRQNQSGVTKGGIAGKCKVAEDAQKLGIYVILTDGREEGIVLRILRGEPGGTLIIPKSL